MHSPDKQAKSLQVEGKPAVVVAGTGAAGLATAITAVRRGLPVFLVEKSHRIGGTVTQCLIHTIGGLHDFNGQYINPGLSKELADRLLRASSATHVRKMGKMWVLVVAPELYEAVVEAWLEEESNIHLLRSAQIISVIVKGDSVECVKIVQGERPFSVEPRGLVDATGNGSLVRMTKPELFTHSDVHVAVGLIFQIGGLKSGIVKFPNNIQWVHHIRQAAKRNQLPLECSFTWIDAGVHDEEAYIKLTLPGGPGTFDDDGQRDLMRQGIVLRDALMVFLRSFTDFSDSQVIRTGIPGIRYAGSVRGEYYLTEADIRAGRQFSDCACRGCWPIEYWDSATGVSLEYLPDGRYYEIPLSALRVFGFKNFWVPGKCFSAEPRAQASARIVGCCWAMGEAVGKAIV